MTCVTTTEANTAYLALIAGEDFSLTPVDLTLPEFTLPSSATQIILRASSSDVTSKEINGTGSFDIFSAGIAAHLKGEYEANRITGADYTKAYIALMETALSQSVQFTLNKDQVFWQTQLAQAQALAARVTLMTAKVQLAQAEMEAKTSAANFALTKMKIRESELASCTAEYNLNTTLPKQTSLLHSQIGKTNAEIGIALEQRLLVIEQTSLAKVEIDTAEYNLATTLPKQTILLQSQIDKTNADTGVAIEQREMLVEQIRTAIVGTATAQYNLATTLPAQTTLLHSQNTKMIAETAVTVEQRLLTIEQTQLTDAQIDLNNAQVSKVNADTSLTNEQKEVARANTLDTRSNGAPVAGVVGKQIAKLMQEIMMLQEQIEATRASTSGTRTDGTVVAGSIGKQIALHQAQIESFRRDAETKIAKLMVDMWVTQKTIDEGLLAPSGFSNTEMNEVLGGLRTNTGL